MRLRSATIVCVFICWGCSEKPTVEVASPAPTATETPAVVADSTPPVPASTEIEMTAVEWVRMRDQKSYDLSHLNGKTVRLSGVVGDVGIGILPDSNSPTITFEDGDGFWLGLECFVPGPPLWTAVRPGQIATIEYAHDDRSTISPKACRLVGATGEPASIVNAQEFVDQYTQDPNQSNQLYTVNSMSRRIGLGGIVREVIDKSGGVLIIFETESTIAVTADISRNVADAMQLPAAGQRMQVWGSYKPYVAPGPGEDTDVWIHSVGVVGASPFPEMKTEAE